MVKIIRFNEKISENLNFQKISLHIFFSHVWLKINQVSTALHRLSSYVPPKIRFLHTKCTEFWKLFFVAWLLKNPLVPVVSQLEVQFKNSLEKVSITCSNRSWLIHIKNDSNMATEIDW